MTTLTDSMVRQKVWYKSSLEICNSSKARSTLLTTKTGLTRSVNDCRSTVSVWTQTPSMVSTTTKALSSSESETRRHVHQHLGLFFLFRQRPHSPIGNTQSGGDLTREIDVTGRVD